MSQYQREPAVRVLASSFNNATYTFKDGDDERSPKFGILPTGVAVNRVLFMGTLTEIDDVGNDQTYLRGRVVDPTGAINVYAGQYQPEALSTLETLEAPTYVAVVGKLNTFEDDDGNVHVSIRPEQISTVSQAGRDRFLAEATSRTLKRIQALEQDEHPNAGIVEQYDVEASDLREAIQPAIDEFRRREERQTVKDSPADPVPS
jgi:RPA family protein